MAEFPDNVPTLDPLGAPKPKMPLWRRVRAWTLVVGLYVLAAGLTVGAFLFARSAFRPGLVWEDRLFQLVCATGVGLFPGAVIWFLIRRRWKSGRWAMTKPERVQQILQCSTQSRVGNAGQPWSMVGYGVSWGSYSAMEATCPLWQRIAGWGMLIVFGAFVLSLIGGSVILIGAGVATISSGGVLIIGIGLLLLIWPAVTVRALVRRKRAGGVRVSWEELEGMRAQRTAWRVRESGRSLRYKIVSTVICVSVYGLWWVRVTLHHAQHPHESWMTPAIWTPFLLYMLWVQFRKPKTAG
jgi:hypothetical protein